jgi:hypothetical protein
MIIAGDGQESTLLTYYIATDPRMQALTPKPIIYLIQSIDHNSKPLENGAPTLLNGAFWREFVKTTTADATGLIELSFWNYLRHKPFYR